MNKIQVEILIMSIINAANSDDPAWCSSRLRDLKSLSVLDLSSFGGETKRQLLILPRRQHLKQHDYPLWTFVCSRKAFMGASATTLSGQNLMNWPFAFKLTLWLRTVPNSFMVSSKCIWTLGGLVFLKYILARNELNWIIFGRATF